MAAPTTTTSTMVNGIAPSEKLTQDLVEYAKILKLRDDVFAGNHPRLTVPAQLLRRVSPASSKSAALSEPALSQPVPQRFPGLGTPHEEQDEHVPQQMGTRVQPAPTAAVSGIDPVLLTKSDGLLRAENQMKRHRLEKSLRDQFERKRLDFRKFPNPAEAKPDFDVSTLLANAKQAAASLNLSDDANGKGDDSDSVDENSFYSSRAPDSTPDGAAQSPSPQQQVVAAKAVADAPAAIGSSLIQHSAAAAHPAPSSRAPTNSLNNGTAIDVDEEDEEGEYSPPETTNNYPTPRSNGPYAVPDVTSRPMRRYSDLDHNGKRAASAGDGSSRMERHYPDDHHRGRAASPSQSPETVQQRNKRRKIERKNEKRNRRNGIKQENVSPPPFHEITPLGQGKIPQPDNRPIVVDDPPSPLGPRYVHAPANYPSPATRPSPQQAEYVPFGESRVLSRTAVRPRDDQNLRKVASLHNLRAEQPQEYVEYITTPTRRGATAYVRVESPAQEVAPDRGIEYEPAAQAVRVVRTPVPAYREAYSAQPEVRYIAEPVTPTVRERIVVDQYGRRFREIVEERASGQSRAASQALTDRQLPLSYGVTDRVRAPSIMIDERHHSRYPADMMPPPAMRQAFPSPVPVSREIYTSSEAGSVQIGDRVSRQVIYADDSPPTRGVARFASTRPPVVHYNERPPFQTASRATSVRPDHEHLADRASIYRGSIPVEKPHYRVVEPEPQIRYVDQYGREVRPPPETREIRYVSEY